MERVETQASGNQRDRILDVLREHANQKGYVTGNIQMIARATGISEHDVAKHLWGLQKLGLIGFSTKRGAGKTVPFRFRLRRRMLNDTQPEQDSAGLGDRAPGAVTYQSRRSHPVGPDLLDPTTARRRQLEESGIVEVRPGVGMTQVSTAIEVRGPGRIERLMQDTPPEVTEWPSSATDGSNGAQAPVTTEKPKEAGGEAPIPWPLRELAAGAAVRQDPVSDVKPTPWAGEYPLITEVLTRRERKAKAEEAARALEAAGLDDLALRALDAYTDLAPLEAEVASLVRRMGLLDDWEAK